MRIALLALAALPLRAQPPPEQLQAPWLIFDTLQRKVAVSH